MSGLQLAGVEAAPSANGSSGIGLVVTVVGLTIGAALLFSWLIGRLPEKTDDSGWMPFSRRRRRDPFNRPPDGPSNPPPRGPFDT